MEEGKHFELMVTTSPPFEEGTGRGTIVLETNLSEVPNTIIPVATFRSSSISVVPTEITLPDELAESFRQEVLVRNIKGQSFEISNVRVNSNKLIVRVEDSRPKGQSYRLIIIAPEGYELPEGGDGIEFKTSDPATPQVILPIRQIHHGTVPKTFSETDD